MFFFICSSLLALCLGDPGTTLTIEEIIKGRCYDQAGTNTYLKTFKWDCESIYDNFTSVYIGKDPTAILPSDFQPFLKLGYHPVPVNKSMFWTGSSSVTYNPNSVPNRDLVHEYSYYGYRYWTLEDTMWGSMINGLSFCGASLEYQALNNSIFNFSTCMSYGQNGSSHNYWNAASAQFAQTARGDVYMLGYANNRRIYRTGTDPDYPGESPSVFASVEIYNLNASQITKFTALIIPNSQYPQEKCGSGSVAQMQRDLTLIAGIPAKNVFCEDNPDAVRHLVCVDDWATPQCAFLQEVAGDNSSSSGLTKGQIWGTAIVIGFVAGALALYIGMRIRHNKKDDDVHLILRDSD